MIKYPKLQQICDMLWWDGQCQVSRIKPGVTKPTEPDAVMPTEAELTKAESLIQDIDAMHLSMAFTHNFLGNNPQYTPMPEPSRDWLLCHPYYPALFRVLSCYDDLGIPEPKTDQNICKSNQSK